ncbi:MAG: zf-HC2 domain-containing protein [Planctomycetes bacterium]|nr:zf-HC2 domain-containing protein [Planctomycetota bacterium]
MSCQSLADLLYPFVDGELSVEQNVTILKHLELCSNCAARVARERDLRGLVNRAAREPVNADTHALVASALDRAEAVPPRRLWVRFAAAAVLLIGVGVGLLVSADPFCWQGCPTLRLAHAAARAAQDEPPLSLEELRESFPRPLFVPAACGVDVKGGHLVAAAGAPPRPLLRLRCAATGQESLFLHVPEGHSHFWQRRERADGRVYLEARSPDGLHLVGWRAKGGIYVCLTDKEVQSDALFDMAAAVRDAFPAG